MFRTFLTLIFPIVIIAKSCDNSDGKKKVTDISKRPDAISFVINDSSYVDSLLNHLRHDSDKIQITPDSLGEFISAAFTMELPKKPASQVNDYELILNQAECASLNSMIADYETATTNQIAIITLDARLVNGKNFDSLVTAIGNYWGVGKRNENNGIIIGISTGLRKIWIATGEGMRKKLPDDQLQKIINETFIPAFRDNSFYRGIQEGIDVIIKKTN